MKKILHLILLFLFIGNIGIAQTLLLQESFEVDETNYDANTFSDDVSDYFMVYSNGLTPPTGWPEYMSNIHGATSKYFAAEDTNDDDNGFGATESCFVVIKKLDVSSYEKVQVTIAVGAPSNPSGGIEGNETPWEGLEIQYAFDANIAPAGNTNVNLGTYTTIGAFKGEAANTEFYKEDTDLDNIGDGTQLSSAFQDFTYIFNTDGKSEVSIRIEVFIDGSEEIAFDNIRIYGITGALPEMNVTGNSTTIPDDDSYPSTSDDTDFGSYEISSGSNTNTFTIENTGTATLNLTDASPYVSISGNDSDFTLSQTPSNSIASSATSNFQIKFDPVATGLRIAEISIANNDIDENPYNFRIQGVGSSSVVQTPTQGELDNFTTGIAGAVASTRLDDNNVLIIYRNGTSSSSDYLKAVIGTVSGTAISYGSTVEIENSVYTNTSVVALSSTKAVVFYHHDEATDRVRYNVLDISGDNITVHSSGIVGTGFLRSGTKTLSAIALNENQLVIAFQAEEGANDNLYVHAGTVNAQDITWGTEEAVSTNITFTDITRLSDSQFALVYSQIDGDGKIVSGTVSGNSISLGSSQTFENSTDVKSIALEALSSSQLVIAYEDEGSNNPDDFGYIMYATISGTTFSFPGEKVRFYYNGDGIDDLDLGMLSSTEVFLAVDGGAGDPSVYYVGELSSNNINLSSETTFLADQADDISVDCLTSSLVVLNYTDDENNSGVGEDNGASRVLTFGTVLMPEIDIQGNSVSIADDDSSPSLADHTDFGSAGVSSGYVARTFTIENTGTAALNLTGSNPYVSISGTHASDFSITGVPTTPVATSGSTTFEVTFNPSATGNRSATISIANNDSDENPYNFNIQGTGIIIAPTVTTDAATLITTTTVKLNGTLNANGADATVTFEYGLTDSYGTTVTADENPVTGTSDTPVSFELTGLNPSTTYHFRVVGENPGGTTNGSDLTFTTIKYDQVITFTELSDKTTNDPDFNAGATSDLGLNIAYSSSNEQVATIVSGLVHIVGAGTTDITASQEGNDTVNVATPVVQSLTVTQATGLENKEFPNLKIYPNPVRDYLSIDVGDSNVSNVEISIIDLSGKIVYNKNYNNTVNTIDVSSYNSGLYFVEIKTIKAIQKLKLIIE